MSEKEIGPSVILMNSYSSETSLVNFGCGTNFNFVKHILEKGGDSEDCAIVDILNKNESNNDFEDGIYTTMIKKEQIINSTNEDHYSNMPELETNLDS